MRRIHYIEIIRKRGWLGIPYRMPKLRTAHVDERRWQQLRGKPFSLSAMLL